MGVRESKRQASEWKICIEVLAQRRRVRDFQGSLGAEVAMSNRLPELSYRLAHHLPDALPFIVPFYNKLTQAGFEIDEHHIRPVIRRNGYRIVTDHTNSSVTFRHFREQEPIATVDLARLCKRIEGVKKVRDYAAVDAQIARIVDQLVTATEA
jgi:hypothetical protein